GVVVLLCQGRYEHFRVGLTKAIHGLRHPDIAKLQHQAPALVLLSLYRAQPQSDLPGYFMRKLS
ncbi:hypothetical protein, partial [Idiomarina abyssalis]|uniref:hypothetical protein n=1 Tax=Idiomarina abyssalis TaxID=86102 RepID=UPI00241DD718